MAAEAAHITLYSTEDGFKLRARRARQKLVAKLHAASEDEARHEAIALLAEALSRLRSGKNGTEYTPGA